MYICLHDEGVSAIRTDRGQVYRPRGDLQRDHDKLIEDEGGEGNRDDIEELVFEKYERHDHDGTAWEGFYQQFAIEDDQVNGPWYTLIKSQVKKVL